MWLVQMALSGYPSICNCDSKYTGVSKFHYMNAEIGNFLCPDIIIVNDVSGHKPSETDKIKDCCFVRTVLVGLQVFTLLPWPTTSLIWSLSCTLMSFIQYSFAQHSTRVYNERKIRWVADVVSIGQPQYLYNILE